MRSGVAIAILLVGALSAAYRVRVVYGQRAGPQPPAVRFELGEMRAAPGEIVEVPLQILTDTPLSMMSSSVEYDPQALEFIEPTLHPAIRRLIENHPLSESLFAWFASDQEGWLQLSLVVDFRGRESFSIPPGLLVSLATLEFRVRADAPRGRHPLRFTRPDTAGFEGNFRNRKGPVYNVVRRHGRPFREENRFEEVTEPAVADGAIIVAIIGDVGIFVRGDANIDLIVDISDPLRILEILFMGGAALECPKAADANNDGHVDISDPVIILLYLFSGTTEWRPSEFEANSPDGLGCSI